MEQSLASDREILIRGMVDRWVKLVTMDGGEMEISVREGRKKMSET